MTQEIDTDLIDTRDMTYGGKTTLDERSDGRADGLFGSFNSTRTFEDAGIEPGERATLVVEAPDGEMVAIRRNTQSTNHAITLPMKYRRRLGIDADDELHWWVAPAPPAPGEADDAETESESESRERQASLTETTANGGAGATYNASDSGRPLATGGDLDAFTDANARLLATLREIESDYGAELTANVLKSVSISYGVEYPDHS